jgi:hypothetical protein
MKKSNLIIALIALIFLNSCEDVVQVDLKTTTPKLVVEAAIIWYKNSTGNAQRIKLTTTTDFYNNVIPAVSDATVFIKNSTDTIFNFEEVDETGEYICTNFKPEINETYTLTIINNGETYTATEILKSVAPITKIEQNNEGGFTGNDIEIKTYYDDPSDETNYYLYKYSYTDEEKQNYYVDEDSFFQGNQFFSISQNDEIKIGDEIIVTHFGVSKSYYNYMNVLLSIAGSGGGSPFQSPLATVRGNIINTINPKNYALGYFSLCETDIRRYVIK